MQEKGNYLYQTKRNGQNIKLQTQESRKKMTSILLKKLYNKMAPLPSFVSYSKLFTKYVYFLQ